MLTLLVPLLLVSAVAAAPAQQPQECLDPSIGTLSGGVTQFFPSPFRIISSGSNVITPKAINVTVATFFTVEYRAGYKLVSNIKNPAAVENYALYTCGSAPPPSAELPEGTKVFKIPLTSVAVYDAGATAFMRLLGVADRITAASAFSIDPCLQQLALDCKKDGNAIYSTDAAVKSAFTNSVDALFNYSPDSKEKLSIAVTAAEDKDVLARAEWIKYVSTFFNVEDVANSVFSTITQNYISVQQSIASVAPAVDARPVLAWIIYFKAFPDFGVSENIQISFAAYKANYTQAAGGKMLDQAQVFAIAQEYDVNATSSATAVKIVNMTAAAQIMSEVLALVDIVVDESRYPTADPDVDMNNADITTADFLKLYRLDGVADAENTFKFIKNNKIIRVDASANRAGYTDWFERALARPDQVLKELGAIVTPAAAAPSVTLQGAATAPFLRLLGPGKSVTLTATPTQCGLQQCAFTYQAICPPIYKACDGTIVAATSAQRCAPSCPTSPAASPSPAAGSRALPAVMTTVTAAAAGACIAALL